MRVLNSRFTRTIMLLLGLWPRGSPSSDTKQLNVSPSVLKKLKKLRAKSGVEINIGHLRPEVAKILKVALSTAPEMVDNTVWVTSANDGEHGEGSFHFKDQAFDIRIRNVKGFVWGTQPNEAYIYQEIVYRWVRRLRDTLGSDYDVVYADDDGGHMDHIHIEWDK